MNFIKQLRIAPYIGHTEGDRMKRYLILFSLLALASCGPYIDPYQEEYNAASASGQPLVITAALVGRPNSVGGVDVYLDILNLSSKTIKYLKYRVVPFNAVGDSQRGSIRRYSTAKLNDTGPYAPMSRIPGRWGTVWYNNTIRCIVVTRVEITYMDGSKRTFGNAAAVQSIMRSDLRNSCAV